MEQLPSINIKLDIDIFKSKYICIFKELKEELTKIIKDQTDISNLFNSEINIKEMEKLNNYIPILKKNVLKGQKILIVMLWSYEIFENENKAIHPKYIKKPFIENNNCIKTATDYFGIEIEIADDYETALEQLKENENGKCKFFAIWVICGPKINRVPNPKGDPTLINNFIKVLQIFWNNGGSIADGEPLFFK